MPNTLSNFLIGVGLDFKTDDVKKVNSGLDSVKRSALQVAGAVAGAFGAKAITADVANRTNQYRQMAEAIGTTTESLDALTRVYEREGGNAGSLISQLEAIKRLRAGLLTNNLSWIPEGALAGLNTDAIIGESDPVKAYENILRQLSGMSVEQRLNVADAIGLDTKSINLAIKGADYLQEQIERALDRRPLITQLEKDSEMFAKEWSDLWDNIAGITDRASLRILPAVNEILGSMNNWNDVNRDLISQNLDAVLTPIADNLEEVAAAGALISGGGLLAGLGAMAKHIPLIGSGLSTAALAAARISTIAGLATATPAAAGAVNNLLSENVSGYTDLDTQFTKWLYDVTGIDFSRGNVYEGTVITPQQVAPLSAPVRAAQDYTMDRGQSYNPYPAQQKSKTRTLQPVTIQVGNQTIKQIVIETMDDEETQTVKDIRSPMVK